MRRSLIVCLALAALLLSSALPAAAEAVLSFPYEFGGIGFDLPGTYKKEADRSDGNAGFVREQGTTARIVFEVYESETSEADFESAARETLEKAVANMTEKNADQVEGDAVTIAGHPAIELRYCVDGASYRVYRTVNETSGSGLTIWFIESAATPSEAFEADVEKIVSGAYPRDGVRTAQAGTTPAPTPTPAPKPDNPQIRYGNVTVMTCANVRLEISGCFGGFDDRVEKDGATYFCAERNTSSDSDLPGDAFLQLSAMPWSGDPDRFGTDWEAIAQQFLDPYGATVSWLHTTMNHGGMAIQQFFIEQPDTDGPGFNIRGALFYNYAAQRVVCALIYESDRARYDYREALVPMIESATLDNKSLPVDESQVDPALKATLDGYIQACEQVAKALRDAHLSGGKYPDNYSTLVDGFEQAKAKFYGADWSGLSPTDRAYVDKTKQIIDETSALINNILAGDAVSGVMDALFDMIGEALEF